MNLVFSLIFILSSLATELHAQECISHQANLGEAPENSLEGLRLATAMGVQGIEFDVQMTRDGHAILYHDNSLADELLGEQCPRGTKLKKLNLRDFQGKCWLENGEEIPLVKQGLDELEDYTGYIFIDLKKVPNAAFLELVDASRILKKAKVRFLSFKKRALWPIRKRWSGVETILLSRYIPRGLFHKGVGFNTRLRFFSTFYRWLGKDTAHWTLNSKNDILKALDKKADFIITDDYPLCESLVY